MSFVPYNEYKHNTLLNLSTIFLLISCMIVVALSVLGLGGGGQLSTK